MVGRILARWGSKSDQELREAVEAILADVLSDETIEPEDAVVRTEGGIKLRTVREYERDRVSRNRAIALHGTSCMGCGSDFERTYGVLGRGYIEVHHAIPLAEFGVRETNEKTDLAVLCANCHRDGTSEARDMPVSGRASHAYLRNGRARWRLHARPRVSELAWAID